MPQRIYITGSPNFHCLACATPESRDHFIDEMKWSGFSVSALTNESPPEWSWLLPSSVKSPHS